ncbi:MAG: alginate lyase family protein, partial [Planctomycetota bacterium]
LSFCLFALCQLPCYADAPFTHPGLLHTREDVDRIRKAIENHHEPIDSAFKQFQSGEFAQANYRPRGPFPYWARNPDRHSGEARDDATAAYHNALMWAITGRQEHADKSIRLINAWKGRLKQIGGSDGVLAVGIEGFKFVNAAEILRHTQSGWSNDDAKDTERWFREVLHPTIKDYAHFANGNWETSALQTKMAIAVYCDDRQLFEETIRYAVYGSGNGSILHTIVYPTGQCQESTRRQHYAQLGIGLLCCAAEIAWNQGVDLYGWADNRILKGFEYTAAYGLGKDVPYQHYLDRTGKYGFGGMHQHYVAISPVSRGNFRPIFEQPYNHYAKRRGLETPNLSMVVQRKQPEGYSGDHASHGTLTHTRNGPTSSKVNAPPGVPAGLVARSTKSGIQLSWAGSVEPLSATDADSYNVERATVIEGPWKKVATFIEESSFLDDDVQRGNLYFYRVSAFNTAGESGSSVILAASAGLPEGWSSSDIGEMAFPGFAEFDGNKFTLEAEGND